ncbi:MAG: CDP-alcohol phosphatidyltransferase family protein [Rhizobiaceae bacterium]|nr:CDP-alcohol phosphatidyltransferase family protein [Rhizobiaceae bacterium]
MLDGWARQRIDPALNKTARALVRIGATPNAITIASCLIGLAAAAAIAAGDLYVGLFLLLVSRLGDGLDGAVAKITGSTDFGGFLDIVLDFVFYGAIPLGFVLLDPTANAIAGAVLIFSFYVNGASFLAYAVMAEKRGESTDARGAKSLFFTTGLAEATETILFFIAFCLLPAWFPVLACVFAALTFYTALSRIVLAASAFRNKT